MEGVAYYSGIHYQMAGNISCAPCHCCNTVLEKQLTNEETNTCVYICIEKDM